MCCSLYSNSKTCNVIYCTCTSKITKSLPQPDQSGPKSIRRRSWASRSVCWLAWCAGGRARSAARAGCCTPFGATSTNRAKAHPKRSQHKARARQRALVRCTRTVGCPCTTRTLESFRCCSSTRQQSSPRPARVPHTRHRISIRHTSPRCSTGTPSKRTRRFSSFCSGQTNLMLLCH